MSTSNIVTIMATALFLKTFMIPGTAEQVPDLSGQTLPCNYTAASVAEDSEPTALLTDPCQVCWCQNSATVCKRLKCPKVECDYAADETLTLSPSDCCPSCSGRQRGCHHQGHVARHNEVWHPSKCQTCYCTYGQVFCKQSICQERLCPIGHILQDKPDLCCPTCIRAGRIGSPCIHSGNSYSDGDVWPTTPCSICYCHQGIVQCFIEECPPKICSQNETAVIPKGECCPMCIGYPCIHGNIEYKSGARWNPSPCEHCSCHNGNTICFNEACKNHQCVENEKMAWLPNQCCPLCVSKKNPCSYKNETHFDGDMWKVSACDFCICENGKTTCHTASCSLLICQEDEEFVHQLGKCCTECVLRDTCVAKDGSIHYDGDVWQQSSCQLCRCIHGNVHCYLTMCVGCPRGFTAIDVEGHCCPLCRKIQCQPACRKCDTYHPEQCLICADKQLVLQEGQCLTSCDEGHYVNSQRMCDRCHSTCVSCSGPSQYHCTDCLPNHIKFNGQCVSHCPDGFYLFKNLCQECHYSCSKCLGPDDNHCTSCSLFEHLLQLNRCVEKCDVGFYMVHNGYCEECDTSCRTCVYESTRCTSCHQGEFLLDKLCVEKCEIGFHPTGDGICSACHASCADCRGSTALQCTRCNSGHVLLDGQCFADNCSDGYYAHNGMCEVCHSSCRLCVGPSENHCLSCARSEESLVRIAYKRDGFCTDVCPVGFYRSLQNICEVCDEGCIACHSSGPASCTSCPEPLVLRGGQCVASCGSYFFLEGNICQACHPSCATCYEKRAQDCASCHQGRHLLISGRCSSPCNNGHYMDESHTCRPCDSSCKECTRSHSEVGSVCGECRNARHYLQKHECVPTCGKGFSFTGSYCEACHESCATCFRSGRSGCSTCHRSKVLTHLSTCATDCFDGHYAKFGVCYVCATNCLHCTADGQCEKCRNPTMVLAFGECVSQCPDQHFSDRQGICRECSWTCNGCRGPTSTDCISCMPGFLLLSGSCVKQCSDGHYRIGAVCRACNHICKTCFGPGLSCTSCRSPELLLDGKCSLWCGFQKFANMTTQMCEDCPEGCARCSSRLQCDVCLNGFVLNKKNCYKFCGGKACRNYTLCEGNIFTAVFRPSYQLLVSVGEWISLKGVVLNASDSYRTIRLWLLNVPVNGVVVYMKNGYHHSLKKGDSFTLTQLNYGYIGFLHILGLPLTGYIQFGTSLEGSCPTYTIAVQVVSLHPPVVLTNQPLVVKQGQYKALGTDVLDVEDLDNEMDVVMKVIDGPVHGNLVDVANHQRNISSFKINDLHQETILYVHNNLERNDDFIILQLSDGYSRRNLYIHIHIITKKQSTPVLVRNLGILVPFGDDVTITKEHLQAVDSNSASNDVIFTVLSINGNSQEGNLVLMEGNQVSPSSVDSETHAPNTEVPVYEFKQTDINAGKILYRHSGIHGNKEEYILFEIQDSADPPNVLINQIFTIKIDFQRNASFGKIPVPQLMLRSQLHIEILDGEITTLTSSHLMYSDSHTEAEDIVYTLKQSPGADVGSFEHVDRIGIQVFGFTQRDINEQKIVYRPLAFTTEQDILVGFSVSAHSNHRRSTLADQFLRIHILKSNHVKPSFRVDHPVLVVSQGGSVPIDASYFGVEDADTSLADLVFSVTMEPKFGSVMRISQGKHTRLKNGTDLTYEDVLRSRFVYVNDGLRLSDDEFEVTVTDGKFNDSLHIYFLLEAVENENSLSDETTLSHLTNADRSKLDEKEFITSMHLPHINVLHKKISNKHKKATASKIPLRVITKALQQLEEKDGMIVGYILEKNLAIDEPDVPPHLLVYNVSEDPQYGYLELVSNPGVQVTAFSQADVNSQNLRYVLKSRQLDITLDQFSFTIRNAEIEATTFDTLLIHWSWITFTEGYFAVGESENKIRIKIKRYGQLEEYSMVQCETVDGSAVSRISGKEDFIALNKQIQFDLGDEEKECTIAIVDNSEFEGLETFHVRLTQPVYALIGDHDIAEIAIDDNEDEPAVAFSQIRYDTKENAELFSATIVRYGDVSSTVSAVCSTVSHTARGSDETSSGMDFISRIHGDESRVIMKAGVSRASCDIKLVDDFTYEGPEQFEIVLSDPSDNCRTGNISVATVVIEGPNDEVTVQFTSIQYVFEEKSTMAEVELVRMGPDLSEPTTVWCSTVTSDPHSAQPSIDFVPSSNLVVFKPGQSRATCNIVMLDDEADPRLEGNETVGLKLTSATGGVIADPASTSVIITDAKSDAPHLKFSVNEIEISETNHSIDIPIIRKGDIHFRSSVRCFTRQKSAFAGRDFQERPNNDASRIIFQPGEKEKNCTVTLIDDSIFEPVEHFMLKLKDVRGPAGGTLGLDTVKIFITNNEDVPVVQLAKNKYIVLEPPSANQPSTVEIYLTRRGDTSGTCAVRVSTHDGSAKSGEDYHANSRKIEFKPGEITKTFDAIILYNKKRHSHKSFMVLLSSDEAVNVEIGNLSAAAVTIMESETSGSQVMPIAPIVVSLMDYDDVENALTTGVSPGYPLICVTSCDPHFPTFNVTGRMCLDANINQSSIFYRWEVSMPTETNTDITLPFTLITQTNSFGGIHHRVLDSTYFRPHFRVRCVAKPSQSDGNFGIALRSKSVTVGTESGICHAPTEAGGLNGFRRQSFVTSLKYLNPMNGDHPNRLHVHVEILHQDGLLPVLSTLPLRNLEYLLADPLYQQQHGCSNFVASLQDNRPESFLHWPGEVATPSQSPSRPYQFDETVRESQSLLLYNHLDLKNCLWTFDAYYHMTELVDVCEGKVFSNFQVRNASQSFLTVELPLYVTYVYAAAPSGWTFTEHRTDLEFSFLYDNVLWHTGIDTDSTIHARIQVLRVATGNVGQLVIDFKTEAQFRGQFVISHESIPEVRSRILPPDSVATSFNLDLMWSAATFEGPQQAWRATSTYSLKDYSGRYLLELIPCTVQAGQLYTNQEDLGHVCTVQLPERYELPITYQQTNRPVPVIYTLNTSFHLLNNEQMFLSDPRLIKDDVGIDYRRTFSKGQTVFGRVMWNPSQNLDSAYKLEIEKLFICTGQDGYEPTYDPTGALYGDGAQFGCIYPHKNIRFRFLLLDRQASEFEEVEEKQFGAMFARSAGIFATYPGIDGFSFKVDALYKVPSGQKWFLQVIYYIRSAFIAPRLRRSFNPDSITLLSQMKPVSNGTNMKAFLLSPVDTIYPNNATANSMSTWSLLALVLTLVLLFVVMIMVLMLCRRRTGGAASNKVVQSLEEENKCNLYKVAQQRHSRHLDKPTRRKHSMVSSLNSNAMHISVKVKTLPMTVHNDLSDGNVTEV